MSVASSSDSIGSNVSVATVKRAGGTSADDANIPPLPPRNSPTRVIMRPPFPNHPVSFFPKLHGQTGKLRNIEYSTAFQLLILFKQYICLHIVA